MKATLRISAAMLVLASLVSACGGGGGSAGTTVGVGNGGSGGGISAAVVKVSMADATGAATNSLSGGQNGTVKAVFTNNGAPVPNAIVKFSFSDGTLVTPTPASASALTDATGTAVLTIKPASVDTAGALSITADASSGTITGSGSMNVAIGAAPLTIGNLSFQPAPTGSLAAYSTIELMVPITSGGSPVAVAPGLTLTSLCVGDNAATLVPGTIANGVMRATYTNKGCIRGTDTITATIGSSSKTISLAVAAANIGIVQFIGTDVGNSSIVLRGSGGLGRKESAIVTFKVVDQNNTPIAGVDVAFRATTYTGGLTVAPSKGTTDAQGIVTTTVSAGTIPTPVRVIAEATRNGQLITGLSDTLTISTGLPIQRFMSMSASDASIEGWVIDNEFTTVSVLLADQYGNPVSDGTTVNFITEGGAIGGESGAGSCNTVDNTGGCSVRLRSQAFRPINGRVTVLAYVQGIEDFVDSNGNGVYDAGEPFTDLGDPFLDAGKLGPTSGESDKGWLDGTYDPANRDLPVPFGGSTFRAAGDGKWGLTYIRRSAEIVFADSVARIIRLNCPSGLDGTCTDYDMSNPASTVITGVASTGGAGTCGRSTLYFRITDLNNNPMPTGSIIEPGTSDKISLIEFTPSPVPSSSRVGGTRHKVTIKNDDACVHGYATIRVKTPNGVTSGLTFSSK